MVDAYLMVSTTVEMEKCLTVLQKILSNFRTIANFLGFRPEI